VKYARQALVERTQAEEGPPRLAERSREEWARLVKSDHAKRRSARWPWLNEAKPGEALQDLGKTKPIRKGRIRIWRNEAKSSNGRDNGLAERSQARRATLNAAERSQARVIPLLLEDEKCLLSPVKSAEHTMSHDRSRVIDAEVVFNMSEQYSS
jgi:hypothetical protein